MPVIALRGLHFSYGTDEVFHDLTLEVPRGAYAGIIGANGGGKSTLLRLALGLLTPDAGTASLFGVDVARFRDWRRVAYVSQTATHVDASFPITVEAVVGMGRDAHRRPLRRMGADDHARVARALRDVGIWDLRTRRIGDLSGGQRQRVFLARALAGDPELLMLDEPTTGVDPETQEQLYALLRELHRERGVTIVLASHDLAALCREATTITVVQRGVAVTDTPDGLRARPDYAALLREVECYHHH